MRSAPFSVCAGSRRGLYLIFYSCGLVFFDALQQRRVVTGHNLVYGKVRSTKNQEAEDVVYFLP